MLTLPRCSGRWKKSWPSLRRKRSKRARKWELVSRKFSRPSSPGFRPPEPPADKTLRALVFDSVFDVYRGVIGYVRVVSGTMEANHAIMLMSNNSRHEIKEVGVFTPKMRFAGKVKSR